MGPRVVVVGPLPPAVRQALRQAGADDAAAAAGPAAVRDGSHVLVSGADADEAVVAALRGRVAAGQPTFLVGPAVALLPSVVAGFAAQPAKAPAALRQQWVQTEADPRCKCLKAGSVYFGAAASCLRAVPLGWAAAWTAPYSRASVVAGLECGAVIFSQFHPEMSSAQGRSTFTRWLKMSASPPAEEAKPEHYSAATGMITVSPAGVNVGAREPISVGNLEDSELPIAWEACGCDDLLVLGDQAVEKDVLASAKACLQKAGLPVACQVFSKTAALEALEQGAARVVVAVPPSGEGRTAGLQLLQDLPQGTTQAMFSVSAAGGDGWAWEEGEGPRLTEKSVLAAIGEAGFSAAPARAPDLLLRIATGGPAPASEAALSKIESLLAGLKSLGAVPSVACAGLSLGQTVALAASGAAGGFARFPHPSQHAPGKVKGALLSRSVPARVQASGLQYSSVNLQCLVPSLEVKNGVVEAATESGSEKLPLEEALSRYSTVGEVAVIDVDSSVGAAGGPAAREQLRGLFKRYPIRVGGGVRTVDEALKLLNEGAAKVIVGTAATREFLAQLPRDRVVVSVDAQYSPPASDQDAGSWVTSEGAPVADVIADLAEAAGHFQVTFLEQSPGLDLAFALKLASACKASNAQLTLAGQVQTAAEVAAVDEMGLECLVSSTVLGGKLPLSAAITAVIKTDRTDGLYATVVVDHANGRPLGMCYSNAESIKEALRRRRGTYWSRTRGLWVKGESSGDTQELVSIGMDCDRDCLLFTVKQTGTGFCHRHQQTCFGPATGFDKLMATLLQRKASAPAGSYTQRLFDDAVLLKAKLMEEAEELGDSPNAENAAFEAADVFYFALVRCVVMGVDLADIQKNLDFKSLKVYRRQGNAKPQYLKKDEGTTS